MNVLMTSNTLSKEIYLEMFFQVTDRLIRCLIDKWAPFFQYRSDPGFRKHGSICKSLSFPKTFHLFGNSEEKFFMISICFKDSCSSTEEIWRSSLAKLTWERISHNKTTLFKHKQKFRIFYVYFLPAPAFSCYMYLLFSTYHPLLTSPAPRIRAYFSHVKTQRFEYLNTTFPSRRTQKFDCQRNNVFSEDAEKTKRI